MKKSLALAMALLGIISSVCAPLAAVGRRGSAIELLMIDGSRISGELLAVRGCDLILFDSPRRRGCTVAIERVAVVKLKKRSKVLSGLAVGFIGGLGAGTLIARSRHGGEGYEQTGAALLGLFCWGGATLIGGVAGAMRGRPEEMRVVGREAVPLADCLRILRSHARDAL